MTFARDAPRDHAIARTRALKLPNVRLERLATRIIANYIIVGKRIVTFDPSAICNRAIIYIALSDEFTHAVVNQELR